EKQYDSMRAWIGYMHRQTGERLIWDSGFHFADWLAVEAPDSQFPNPVSDPALVATAYFGYSASLMEKTARVLGREAEAAEYAQLLEGIQAAFCAEFVSPRGRIAGNSQTAYVLALQFELLPPEQRPEAARRLAADIVRRGSHLTTGFLGTSHICHVLSSHGYLDLAYALLEQETYPSWLYNVKLGATTSWERWDNIRPDGSFQTPNANSFNHYAFGAIGDWLYRVVAGLDIDPDQPGYQRILFRPRPGGSLTHASASLETPYGRAESSWRRDPAALELRVTVPPNAEGVLHLPAQEIDQITESGRAIAAADGISDIQAEQGIVVIHLGSGQYTFTVRQA
ncbi:MAG: alpha-L-rhamnosidase C-terminal domain-containing protein, partial [Anaerolineales bacterium]